MPIAGITRTFIQPTIFFPNYYSELSNLRFRLNFFYSKVIAKIFFVSLRAFGWYQNHSKWPRSTFLNIIQSCLNDQMNMVSQVHFLEIFTLWFLIILRLPWNRPSPVVFTICLLVSVQWPAAGRLAWCLIHCEKKFRLFRRRPPQDLIYRRIRERPCSIYGLYWRTFLWSAKEQYCWITIVIIKIYDVIFTIYSGHIRVFGLKKSQYLV